MTRNELKKHLESILNDKYQGEGVFESAMNEYVYDYNECHRAGHSMEISGRMTKSGNPVLLFTDDEILD
jgi:hypothetical protein